MKDYIHIHASNGRHYYCHMEDVKYFQDIGNKKTKSKQEALKYAFYEVERIDINESWLAGHCNSIPEFTDKLEAVWNKCADTHDNVSFAFNYDAYEGGYFTFYGTKRMPKDAEYDLFLKLKEKYENNN